MKLVYLFLLLSTACKASTPSASPNPSPSVSASPVATSSLYPVPTVSACPLPPLPAAGTYTKTTYPYVTHHGVSQKLDLYLPLNVKNPPIVMLVHGGSWYEGGSNNANTVDAALRLVSSGYAAASINYRLTSAPGVSPIINSQPAAIQDVRCAAQWLKTQGKTYGYNGSKLVAMGQSAGGHLVGLLGTAANPGNGFNSPDCAGPSVSATSDVAGVVDYYGLYDMTDINSAGAVTVTDYLGVNPWDGNPSDMTVAINNSPDHLVSATTVPFFIAHGSKDNLVLEVQQTDMLNALTQFNVPHTYFLVSGEPHGFYPFDSANKANIPQYCTMLSFLGQILK